MTSETHQLFDAMWEAQAHDTVVTAREGSISIDPILNSPFVHEASVGLWGLIKAGRQVYGLVAARHQDGVSFDWAEIALMTDSENPQRIPKAELRFVEPDHSDGWQTFGRLALSRNIAGVSQDRGLSREHFRAGLDHSLYSDELWAVDNGSTHGTRMVAFRSPYGADRTASDQAVLRGLRQIVPGRWQDWLRATYAK